MVIQTVRGQLAAIDPEKKRRFLLAVSTGVDSMVLLQVFCQLFPEMQKEPCFGVAHVNHQLRPASAEEAAFYGSTARNAAFLFMSGVGKIRQKPA